MTEQVLPPDEAKRILRERAQRLAQPLEEAPAPIEALELLVFSLGTERYGIELAHSLEVVAFRGLTPVPSTPPFVLGVLSYRGRILPVLDIRRLLGVDAQGIVEGSRVVAVEAGGMTFGIYADSVTGTVRVGPSEMAPPPVSLGGQAFLRGVTADMVAVLDLETLVQDPRVVVNENVG